MKSIIWNNRIKSLLWRAAMMGIATVLAVIAEDIGSLDITPQITVILGLILGEISKAINNSYSKE